MIFLLFFFLLIHPAPSFALDKPFDHSTWDQFLKKFVNENGDVDYQGIVKDPKLLDDYLKQLAHIDKKDFTYFWPREEKLAVWMNAYHAGVIQAVRQHYPLKSLQDVPSIWDSGIMKVADVAYSLNNIRTQQLVVAYRDEKIHTALSCGAKSCPKLMREAYTAARVEGQLFLQARRFVNDPNNNEIIPGKKKIKLSRIFKWYQSDFYLNFARAENDRKLPPGEFAVLSFVVHYLEDQEKIAYLEEGKYKITYSNFDWSLNEWIREKDGSSASPASS